MKSAMLARKYLLFSYSGHFQHVTSANFVSPPNAYCDPWPVTLFLKPFFSSIFWPMHQFWITASLLRLHFFKLVLNVSIGSREQGLRLCTSSSETFPDSRWSWHCIVNFLTFFLFCIGEIKFVFQFKIEPKGFCMFFFLSHLTLCHPHQVLLSLLHLIDKAVLLQCYYYNVVIMHWLLNEDCRTLFGTITVFHNRLGTVTDNKCSHTKQFSHHPLQPQKRI